LSPFSTPPGCAFAQHETSCDPEIQAKEDLKRKFRKQLGGLLIISLNSKDKEEAF